ncbi:MAG: hypothetical protein K1X56_00165 [Flavobacteriales bacterium]|nr:hypothetical protein [Flavobacteriales bacterium]
MLLHEQSCSSQDDCDALIAMLRNLRTNNQIKILEGSFDPDASSIVELLFIENDSKQKWILEGVYDLRGGLTLRKADL